MYPEDHRDSGLPGTAGDCGEDIEQTVFWLAFQWGMQGLIVCE
jgi:hypothetical protein